MKRIVCNVDRNCHRFDLAVVEDDLSLTVYERAAVPGSWNPQTVASVRGDLRRAERVHGGMFPILTRRDREADDRASVRADRVVVVRHYAPEV